MSTFRRYGEGNTRKSEGPEPDHIIKVLAAEIHVQLKGECTDKKPAKPFRTQISSQVVCTGCNKT